MACRSTDIYIMNKNNHGEELMIEKISLNALHYGNDVNNRYFNQVYSDSFPDYEQRTLKGRTRILHEADTFCAWILNHEGENVGILGGWHIGEWFYIEHFAVDKSLRGRGIGRLAMDHINAKFKQVILEIDIPQDCISFKRLAFYKGRGYVSNDITHVHPSYKVAYKPHSLKVLSFPRSLTAQEYDTFEYQLREVVMTECFL
ncbi:GNAT family N-acetyltransferase [Rahnella aquatilis]|nr:GNAT family N-acetyltransferase [Rahnella aquatilis]